MKGASAPIVTHQRAEEEEEEDDVYKGEGRKRSQDRRLFIDFTTAA